MDRPKLSFGSVNSLAQLLFNRNISLNKTGLPAVVGNLTTDFLATRGIAVKDGDRSAFPGKPQCRGRPIPDAPPVTTATLFFRRTLRRGNQKDELLRQYLAIKLHFKIFNQPGTLLVKDLCNIRSGAVLIESLLVRPFLDESDP